MNIIVHRHALKHGLSEAEIIYAWSSANEILPRLDSGLPVQYVALGFSPAGLPVQMVGVRDDNGGWLVFHAMTPPQKSFLKELGKG